MDRFCGNGYFGGDYPYSEDYPYDEILYLYPIMVGQDMFLRDYEKALNINVNDEKD